MKYVQVLFWIVLALGLYVNFVETILVLVVLASIYFIIRFFT